VLDGSVPRVCRSLVDKQKRSIVVSVPVGRSSLSLRAWDGLKFEHSRLALFAQLPADNHAPVHWTARRFTFDWRMHPLFDSDSRMCPGVTIRSSGRKCPVVGRNTQQSTCTYACDVEQGIELPVRVRLSVADGVGWDDTIEAFGQTLQSYLADAPLRVDFSIWRRKERIELTRNRWGDRVQQVALTGPDGRSFWVTPNLLSPPEIIVPGLRDTQRIRYRIFGDRQFSEGGTASGIGRSPRRTGGSDDASGPR
jgi:hypothetical protein